MTGAEHYRRAEAILESLKGIKDPELGHALAATAQVHATLALAATSDSSVPHPTGYPNGGVS